ncbi:Tex family protein [Peijinzhouia sedimentorum]
MIDKIAFELGIRPNQVKATVDLLDEDATVPFISRYRKERTGDLDEVQIMNVRDRITQLRELDKRREAILKSIEDQGKMTDELKSRIDLAETMSELEDIYLPYKPRRRTKATIAREAGLEPLAELIFDQSPEVDPQAEAAAFIDVEKGVETIEQALQGARDIMAEWINENADARAALRKLFMDEAIISSKLISGKEEEGHKYKDYFDWQESFKNIPSHRLLALRRGEKEMILSVDISPEEGTALFALNNLFVNGSCPASEEVEKAARDSYKRLLKPSLETEARMQSKILADEEAIRVFANNLRELLLSSPLGEKKILAVDPGFRTGCKVVYLNKQGKLIENTTIYPNPPQNDTRNADRIIKALYEKYEFEAVAIGNGTAGRETERYFKALGLPSKVAIVQVNESGASIYSASDVAREEFPDYDLTVRGAVSIGRRLMDPLAELVKIDPKSIGVGQYQHDVDQNQLKLSLDDTVVSCVNAVGVDLNTASGPLLSYVSGLGPQLAKNIISYREENGPFKDRKALKKVPRLGDKAFEQSAGFLRITGAKNPLDASAVHPERYELVERMAADLGVSVKDLITDGNLRKRIKLENYITEDVGLPTLKDIIAELEKPGRDPRQNFEAFQFDDAINSPEDLRIGMVLPGIITNITNFGVFVDVGVHQDGLVHISQLSDRFVKDPMEIVKVNQKVKVTVMEVDLKRKRIALSMKSDPYGKSQVPKKREEKREDKRIDLESLKRRFS